jgi:PAS domain-containing protein
MHLEDIAQAILNAPAVGIVIYQEKIVYANKFFCRLTGYSLKN